MIKLAVAVMMYMAGRGELLLMCLFIVSNRVFTEGTCKLCGLVQSDLVDEDFVIHQRSQSVSALVIGMSAFFSKPGQTLAPVVGAWVVSRFAGDHVLFAAEASAGSDGDGPRVGGAVTNERLDDVMFWLLVGVPVLCVVLQLLAWRQFTLHGAHLRRIKELMKWRSNDEEQHAAKRNSGAGFPAEAFADIPDTSL